MIKKFVIGLFLLGSLTAISQAGMVEEFSKWDYSLGGAAYLIEADNFYYSIGAKRDLSPAFGLSEEWLFTEIGYLNDGDSDKYIYVGVSINANKVAGGGIAAINYITKGDFQLPGLFNEILSYAGIIGSKTLASGYNIKTGYDYGVNLSIIRSW